MCVEVSVMANVTIRMDEGLKKRSGALFEENRRGAPGLVGQCEVTAPIGITALPGWSARYKNWSCSNAAGITEIEGATERVTHSMHKLSH